MSGRATPVTPAGLRRVQRALQRHGALLVQGQHELPSVADLLCGAPVQTRGYSWDYVSAWRVADKLAAETDITAVPLLRGRLTLVHARHWPAVAALARAGRQRATGASGTALAQSAVAALQLIEAQPGINGSELRARLDLDARAFQRARGALTQRLLVVGEERADTEHHTHERCWWPWSHGKLARGTGAVLPEAAAARAALLSVIAEATPAGTRPARDTTLLPVLR